MTDQAQATPTKKERIRGPGFPAIPLREAIEKLRTLYAREAFSWTPVNIAAQHWGFSSKSSSGVRAVAALSYFGLVDEDGAGDSRRIRPSERGKVIVLAPADSHSADIDAAVRAAAMSPKQYAELWKRHGPKLPSDQTLAYELVKDGNFNRDSVKGFIKDFKATVEFAKLGESDRLGSSEGAQNGTGPGKEKSDPAPSPDPKKMPELQRTEAVPFDFPIPLVSGGQAILRMPRPMTTEDYEHMTAFLEANLKVMKKALTTSPKSESDRGSQTS